MNEAQIVKEVEAARSDVAKIRAENTDLRNALTSQNAVLTARVAELEEAIKNQDLVAASAAVVGLRAALGEFDADIPDPVPAPEPTPQA